MSLAGVGMWGWVLLALSSTTSLCCEQEQNKMCITCIIYAFLSIKAEKELTFCLLHCTEEETLFLLMQRDLFMAGMGLCSAWVWPSQGPSSCKKI